MIPKRTFFPLSMIILTACKQRYFTQIGAGRPLNPAARPPPGRIMKISENRVIAGYFPETLAITLKTQKACRLTELRQVCYNLNLVL